MLAISLGSGATPASGSSGARPAMSPRPSDDAVRLAAIVERARQGDAEAFGRLYDHYQASVYRAIYAQTRSTPLSEDLAAAPLRALRGPGLQSWMPSSLGPWLYRIARNLVIDQLQGRRPDSSVPTHEPARGHHRRHGRRLIALLTRERVRPPLYGLAGGRDA